jgi:CDP-paratose 2-epimerase
MAACTVLTSHRPAAGQELVRSLVESVGTWGVNAFSLASAWPAGADGGRNQAVIDHLAPGMTCCVINEPRVDHLVKILGKLNPGVIVHAPLLGLAENPQPVDEYRSVVNGTLTWLEAARLACPEALFIHISSTLVYGDRADTIAIEERAKRLEFSDPNYADGLNEDFPTEGSTHSLFGAAAVAADVLAQEYSRSLYLPVCCLRVDAVCDPGNGAADRRDVLSQIAHCCATGAEYVVRGNRGRQVREILGAADLAALVAAIIRQPRPGSIYNVGGGKTGSCSIEEAMDWIETVANRRLRRTYSKTPPMGEPCCYFSDTTRLREDYPDWQPLEPWKILARRAVEAQLRRA